MKLFKRLSNKESEEQKPGVKTKLHDYWKEHIKTLPNKLSAGARSVFGIMKSRAKWGSKKLWGNREKGRHKPR